MLGLRQGKCSHLLKERLVLGRRSVTTIARISRHEVTMATMFLITEQDEYQGNAGER